MLGSFWILTYMVKNIKSKKLATAEVREVAILGGWLRLCRKACGLRELAVSYLLTWSFDYVDVALESLFKPWLY